MIIMSVAIRMGYNVWSTEAERVGKLKALESQGILNLEKDEWQTCRKCKTQNIIDEKFKFEKISTCSNCGKTINLSKNVLTRYTVSSINYKNVVRICDGKLKKAIGKENCVYDKEQRTWICSLNGRKVPVFISEISSYNQYVNERADSNWLCILLDWEKEKGVINHYNQLHFVKIEDILEDKLELDKILKELVLSFDPNVTVVLTQQFDSFIKSVSPTKFEKAFIDSFLNGIRERADLLKDFFSFLSSRKKTIVNSKVVLIGGPANPDFVMINLLEYLQEGLRPDKVGEVKRYYRSTTFSVNEFGVAQAHALGADTVSIVSTNKIQPEVWRLVWETRKKEGYFKHVIFERDTIILLINVLKLGHLLSSNS